MLRLLAGFAAAALTMVLLDLLWLALLAQPLYQQGIGHLMAASPSLPAVLAFYLVYVSGLMVFALLPHSEWPKLLRAAGLYGFFTYATYDLTNLATLKNWPLGLSLLDIAWGVFLCLVSASAGRWAMGRVRS